MRVVLDTNVLVSALIVAGKPRRLLEVLLREGHTLILSEPIIDEFSRISADKKISRYADSDAIASFLAALLSKASFVRPESRVDVLNDPDDKVLATAKDGGADLLSTGDRHILELRTLGHTRIVTIDECLAILRAN